MRTVLLSLTIAALALSLASGAFAQATATASASAIVVGNLTIVKSTDLHFGKMVAGATAGTITLTPTGTRTATGGVTLVTGGTPAPTAAVFAVTGQPDATYAIALPAAAVNLSDGLGHSMTAGSFTSSPSTTGTLDSGGAETLLVGATLSVGAAQTTGTYAGSFPVTVAYN